LSDELVSRLRFGLELKSESNPLIYVTSEKPENYLFMKVMYASMPVEYMNVKTHQAVTTYFTPTLEGIIQNIAHPFDGVMSTELSDEAALYSWIFFQPQINISWGMGANGLIEKIISFIKACLKDLEGVDISRKKPVIIPKNWNSGIVDEYLHVYLKSMPSTAV